MRHRNLIYAATASILLLGGCAGPSPTEADFGNSVRNMVRAQTLNPEPADAQALDSTDGPRLENVLETYRADVAEPSTIERDPTLDIIGGTTR